ncbi:unnamed protein product [Orchesella dallaii]|uniref:F-box domain-containing protein n=1 Tax=Orchesella dallaii TaxID=48710 RepID=A0ABP1QG88_9HEXA
MSRHTTNRSASTSFAKLALNCGEETESDDDSSLATSMEGFPPEVLTIILKHLYHQIGKRILTYRLVNSQWKNVINLLLDKMVRSGELLPFPKMEIVNYERQGWPTYLRYSPTFFLFLDPRNPFPINSLLLSGLQSHFKKQYSEILKPLPEFVATFGRNLTSVALHDPIISTHTLAAILGSMPCLKLLSISDGKVIDNINTALNPILPSAPSLPSLTTLEIKSTRSVGENFEVLYFWLIGSYADQIVKLILNLYSDDPLPVLRENRKFVFTNEANIQVVVATANKFAFGKLRELKVFRPNHKFLLNSNTPKLRSLSVVGLAKDKEGLLDLRSLITFIDKSAGTLEKLHLDVVWNELLPPESFPRPLPLSGRNVTCRHLKIFAIRFPIGYQDQLILETFLVKFPALESLNLLLFGRKTNVSWPDVDGDEEKERVEVNLNSDCDNPTLVIDDIKKMEGFTKRVSTIVKQSKFLIEKRDAAIAARIAAQQELDGCPRDDEHLLKEKRGNLIVARREENLALWALGEYCWEQEPVMCAAKKYLVLHQLIKCGLLFVCSKRVWNVCMKLNRISVSSGDKPGGNVCVLNRPEK